MSADVTPETQEAGELFGRALKLSPDLREQLAHDLLATVDPPPGRPWSDRDYWKAELARRIADVESGAVTPLTREEAEAQVREAIRKLGVEL
jgi:putative addiction module component (TIGR02574 family)